MTREDFAASLFTIDSVLTTDECHALVARAESVGFEIATINASEGPRVDAKVRNNDRVIVDDHSLARDIWERVRDRIPPLRGGRQVRGLNERFRFYRYAPGQKFAWHSDGPFQRENGEMSLLTFMIYLNGGYRGGQTRFEWTEVAGKQGMALVFDHGLMHEGAQLTEGMKYVLRSDVMYGRIGQYAG
jgi:2OG-Fe(II) oxygenase superfamily